MFTLLASLIACGDFGLAEGNFPGPGALLATDPDESIVFGAAAPDSKSLRKEVQFISAGDEAVYVASAWIESNTEGVFTAGEFPFPRTLEPGETIPVSLRFNPTAQGSFHGALVIEVGNDGTIVERLLSGEGCLDDDDDGTCD